MRNPGFRVVEVFIGSRLPQRLRVISGALWGMTSMAFVGGPDDAEGYMSLECRNYR